MRDTPQNQKEAEAKAWQIEGDILAGYFDPTLEKYKPKSYLFIVKPVEEAAKAITLSNLWREYTDYKSQTLTLTTINKDYKRTGNVIKALPSQSLSDAVIIRDYLLSHKSPNAAQKILVLLSASCDWGIKQKLIYENPFAGMSAEIKVPRTEDSEVIDPFTAEERDAIIAAFESSQYYSHYTPFVKFLFWTGCRTSEAIGLQWKHILGDCQTIKFSEALVDGVRKDTKTYKIRFFPCNSQLQALLKSIKPENGEPDALVFKSKEGTAIRISGFHNRAWKGYKNHAGNQVDGILTKLVKEGKVKRYRPQYNTRHTFITMMVEQNIPLPQIAKWVGNSPEIIMKHYCGTLRQIQVPEL